MSDEKQEQTDHEKAISEAFKIGREIGEMAGKRAVDKMENLRFERDMAIDAYRGLRAASGDKGALYAEGHTGGMIAAFRAINNGAIKVERLPALIERFDNEREPEVKEKP